MASTNSYAIAVKELETATVSYAAATGVALAVGYGGAIVTSATTAVYGISKTSTAAAGAGTIVTHGEAVALAGGSISVGDALTATTGGKLIATSTAGNQIIGRALEAASNNQYFRILITRGVVPA